jgi:alpha-maltose-1-phosphate synthase
MVILSHPTGNANVRQAAQALEEAGLLAEFCTSVYWRPDCRLSYVLPGSVTRLLDRRAFPHIPAKAVRCHPWPEVGRLLANQMGCSRLVRHETGLLSVDAVYRNLDRYVARRLLRKRNVLAVHAYEDGALESFRAARHLHIRSIYELPIGYWKSYRDLMLEEAELQPAWADTLSGNADSKAKRDRKDEELALADVILVPSQFVRRTLLKAEKVRALIRVVPYGAPAGPSRVLKSARGGREKLRVIFVGSLGQRKGLSYLLKAIEMLGSRVELTLVGKRVGVCSTRDAACRKYRWISSLPHHEVLDEIQQHDVMVFPSLFEGFGLVLLEAMACGIPVIATPNGAAPDFLTDGEDGFLVPIRDAEAIAAKLYTLSLDRDRLAAMKLTARRKAALQSWESYRAHLVGVMQQALAEHNPPAHVASSTVEFSQT